MYRRMLVLCCVFFVAIMQSGCIGLIINTPEECKNETPYTGVHDIFWIPSSPIKGLSPGLENDILLAKASSKAQFLKDWGKPDEIVISTSENMETWIYNRRLWCGPNMFGLVQGEANAKVIFPQQNWENQQNKMIDEYPTKECSPPCQNFCTTNHL